MSKTRVGQRRGLRIRGQRGPEEVRGACIRFAKWLRANYEFPVLVPVYLLPGAHLTTIDGDKASASFFAPWDRRVEPYIRIATGDYHDLLDACGRDNALAAYLSSLAHEVIHYQQWIATGETTERGVIRIAAKMVDRYALTVDHP